MSFPNILVAVRETFLARQILNFFRIEESNSTRGTNNEKGTGLGLILCQEFIEQ